MLTDAEIKEMTWPARILTALAAAFSGSLYIFAGPCLVCGYLGTPIFIAAILISFAVAIPFVPLALRSISPRGPYLLKFGLAGAIAGALATSPVSAVFAGLFFGRPSTGAEGRLLLDLFLGPGSVGGFCGGLVTGFHVYDLQRRCPRVEPPPDGMSSPL